MEYPFPGKALLQTCQIARHTVLYLDFWCDPRRLLINFPESDHEGILDWLPYILLLGP
jgi:hypothetical protein